MLERYALIIYNPVAGKGDPERRRRDIERLAKAAGWRGKLVQTTLKLHAGKLASEGIRTGYRHIVVCGGDGTIMDLLPAVMGQDVALGIVPMGTGNLLAVNLRLPLRLKSALDVALYGAPRQIVVGKANGQLFSIAAGIGFDAAVIRDATALLKQRIGFLAYTVSVIRNLAHRPHRYSISIDGQPSTVYVAKCVVVANVGKLQGGVTAVPDADAEKASFKVVIIRPETLLAWVGLLLNALAGHVEKHRSYTLLEGRQIKIRSLSGAEPVECDGNLLPSSRHLHAELAAETVTVMRLERP